MGRGRALLAVGGLVLVGSLANGLQAGGRESPATARSAGERRSEMPDTQVGQGSTVGLGVRVAAVSSIIDGDTFRAVGIGPVRLAQVDAPETNECHGPESTAALRALIDGKTVELRKPTDGPARDRYRRTLAEVTVNGKSVNEALIRDGDAEWYESFAKEDRELATRLQAAEDGARREGRGLWARCIDGSPREGSAATSPPTSLPTSTESPSSCHPGYPEECIPPRPPDLDCRDVGRAVRVDHAAGDPHRLDRDKDGWGCESYR